MLASDWFMGPSDESRQRQPLLHDLCTETSLPRSLHFGPELLPLHGHEREMEEVGVRR